MTAPDTPTAPAPEGEYEDLCNGLEALSREMVKQDMDMSLPPGSVDPEDAADAIRTLLARAEAAETRLAEATKALRKAVRGQQRLWDLAQGFDPDDPDDGPRCRDCADEDGTCPFSGYSCDPQQAAEQRMRILFSRLAEATKALREIVENEDQFGIHWAADLARATLSRMEDSK